MRTLLFVLLASMALPLASRAQAARQCPKLTAALADVRQHDPLLRRFVGVGGAADSPLAGIFAARTSVCHSMDTSQNIVLENSRVRLRPLEATDFEELKLVAFDPELWEYTLTRADDVLSLAAYMAAAEQARLAGQRYPFVIIDRASGRLAGSTSYYNIDLDNQKLSIGHTWVGTDFQRTGLNRAAKHLLLGYAFDQLGCERVELETDSRNHKSQTAMRRMGATEEGTLRSHRFGQNNYRRDTVIFSILRPEWHELRRTTFAEYNV